MANQGSNTVSSLLGQGDGTFATQTTYPTGTQPISIAIGDFNGDGKLDLAVANLGSNTVSILLGQGDGTFAAQTTYPTGRLPFSIAIGDLNGDGKLDLALANDAGFGAPLVNNTVSILLGQGDGTFAAQTTYPTGTNPRAIAIGDFNGDGKLDLAVANFHCKHGIDPAARRGPDHHQEPQRQLLPGPDRRHLHHHGEQQRQLIDQRHGHRYRHIARRINRHRHQRHGMDLHSGHIDLHARRCPSPGGSYPAITLTVNVAGNAPASVTNTANVSGGGEVNTANDTASDPTTITQEPDLSITKSHAGNFFQGQTTGATYTITVSNIGSASTSGTVTVSDTLPAGLTATAISGTGWTCTLGTLTCTRSDALASAASYPAITLTVTVAGNAPASVTNTATVSGGGEVNTANDTASDPTTITQEPDLTISKSHTGNFFQGQTGATYTIARRATRAGADRPAARSPLSDTLPAGLTATAISGTGWTCTLGTLTCTRSDALASAASYPAITLTVSVAGNAPASVTNTATVSGGGEVNTANDTASDPTTITQEPDLTITKSHTGNFFQGQTGAQLHHRRNQQGRGGGCSR